MSTKAGLETYLKSHFENNVIDFSLRCHVDQEGIVSFYIHPANKDGETADFTLEPDTDEGTLTHRVQWGESDPTYAQTQWKSLPLNNDPK